MFIKMQMCKMLREWEIAMKEPAKRKGENTFEPKVVCECVCVR